MSFFFFQAEDGIRDDLVTGVQTCALPISADYHPQRAHRCRGGWSGRMATKDKAGWKPGGILCRISAAGIGIEGPSAKEAPPAKLVYELSSGHQRGVGMGEATPECRRYCLDGSGR